MKTICDTLEVARSNIAKRIKTDNNPRTIYKMPDDVWLLPRIRGLTDERPTYGYRRIHAMLNRQLLFENKNVVNHKRVYRIMKHNHLLLTRYKGEQPTRKHDGKIITLKSNLRWCTDVFECGGPQKANNVLSSESIPNERN